MKKSKKAELAEQLYLEAGMDGKEIAEYLDTTEATVSRWNQKYKWKEKKAAKTITRDSIIRHLYSQALKISQDAEDQKRSLTTSETDQLVKIATSIEKLDKKLNVTTCVMVFKAFIEYLVRQEGGLNVAKGITSFQKSFLLNMFNDGQ